MEPTALLPLLNAGPWGIVAILAGVVAWQNKKIDDIRVEQISDTKIALDVVAKSTDKMASAEERMVLQTEANRELIAVAKVLLNKGQVS